MSHESPMTSTTVSAAFPVAHVRLWPLVATAGVLAWAADFLFWNITPGISVGIFTGMMALMFASLTLVYLFWESARLAVLGGLTVFYCAALAAVIIAFRRFVARQPKPFAATLQEIGEDRACIRNPS